MDRILPTEILCKILFSVVAPPNLFVNFSDEYYKYTDEEVVTREDIDDLPTFEDSRIGLAHELSFFNRPVDFHHNIPAYRTHQHYARTGILTCKTFRAILTPILYQCIVLATSTQAQALIATLEDAKLAALVKIIVICPAPLSYPNRALVNRVAGACPNLRAFHNFSVYHSFSLAAHANTDSVVLPTSTDMARLTHDPFSVAQIKHLPAVCDMLVFLELVTPACHWGGELPVLQVALPNLISLKMEQRVGTLTMMQECLMPALQRLCFTRPLRHADAGEMSGTFLKKHGQHLIQLEYPDFLWGIGGRETTLEAICPALKELILDPMHCIAAGATVNPPPIRGAPGHQGVSEIGLRNIASRVGHHAGTSVELNRYLTSLIDTEAFPVLGSVRDMAWHGNAHRADSAWAILIDLCIAKGILFRDWVGNVVV